MPDPNLNRQFSETLQAEFFDLLHCRRDVRGNNFLSTPIEKTHIDTLLKAAYTAPSVGLSTPWKFVLIENLQTKQAIHKNCLAAKQAAAAVFTDAQKAQYASLKLDGIIEAPLNMAVYYVPPDEAIIGNHSMPEMGEYSVVCAIQNMWLMARALNIGMGWVSIITPSVVNTILRAPTHYKLVGYLCFGYAKTFLSSPEFEQQKWKKRPPWQAAVHKETFS